MEPALAKLSGLKLYHVGAAYLHCDRYSAPFKEDLSIGGFTDRGT